MPRWRVALLKSVGFAGVVVALAGCGSEVTPVAVRPRAATAAPLRQLTQPCTARNPVALAETTLERQQGAPDSNLVPFSLSVSSPVCVRVEVPEVNGHRLTSGEVGLDDEPLLLPSDFQQDFAGRTFTRSLAAGVHRLRLAVSSKPGTRIRVRVEVAGPVIDSITPKYGPTGTPILVQGEGFVSPLTVRAGDVPLAQVGVSNEDSIFSTSVDSMPVSALTVSTPFGTATSSDVFVPDQPRNIVQFYPISEFEVPDATCSGSASLRVRHDGSRLGFALLDNELNESLTLDIDLDGEPLTIERQLSSSRRASITTVSGTLAELGLMSHLTLGRMFLRVRTTGACGVRQSEWFELKSAFAPGFVIVRAADPAELAARHGLRLISSEGELSLMMIPENSTMDDTLVALGRDPASQGAVPDPVLYTSTHRQRSGCGISGQVHDTADGVGQWTLDKIGVTNHPDPRSGAGIVVAVADTGVSPTTDLAGALMTGFDFTIFGDGTSADVDAPTSTSVGFHGTSVASIIGARQGNAGIVGIAPGVTILPLRVLGSTHLADGFGLHRALSRVLALRPTTNIQVVNASMGEFVDSIALWAGILARLAQAGGISNVALAAGSVIGSILRSVVSSLHSAGIALVASAGNVPACPGGGTNCLANRLIAAAGPQFPANAPAAYAIASTDVADAPAATSMPASLFKDLALAAPVDNLRGEGAVPVTTPGGGGCFGGTSAAAPQVSGAAAFLLAPPPPLAPISTGTLALARLIETATPLSAPRTAVGAGLLNIATASQPQLIWSFDFQSNFARINDFAFAPGVGDFVLRNGGTTIESIPTPGGNVSTVATGLPNATWLATVPSKGVLLVGYSASVEVRNAAGTLLETRPERSFRAAVSSVAAPGQGELVALRNPDGTVELLRTQPLRSVGRLGPSRATEVYLDALWASEPGASSHQTLALRTATTVELFRVPTGLTANCAREPTGCPVRIGSVALSDTAGHLTPTDWTVVQAATEARVYVVNGSNTLFVGDPLTTVFQGLVVGNQQWVDIESASDSTRVYLQDGSVPALATIDDRSVLHVDSSRAGVTSFLTSSPLRVAPSATYAYAPGRILRGTESWAVFFGGLTP